MNQLPSVRLGYTQDPGQLQRNVWGSAGSGAKKARAAQRGKQRVADDPLRDDRYDPQQCVLEPSGAVRGGGERGVVLRGRPRESSGGRRARDAM